MPTPPSRTVVGPLYGAGAVPLTGYQLVFQRVGDPVNITGEAVLPVFEADELRKSVTTSTPAGDFSVALTPGEYAITMAGPGGALTISRFVPEGTAPLAFAALLNTQPPLTQTMVEATQAARDAALAAQVAAETALISAIAARDAALAAQTGATTQASNAEASRAAAAVIQAALQAAYPAAAAIDVLHPTTLTIPAGWWDTGDRLLSGTATRALISNWQHAMLVPGALWRGTLGASVHAANTGDVDAVIGGPVGEIEDQSGNARHLTQASASLSPTFGRRPRTGIRNLADRSQFGLVDRWSEGTLTSVPGANFRTLTPNTAVAPDGTLTAAHLAESNTNNQQRIFQALSAARTGSHLTMSVYAKAGARSVINLRETGGGGAQFNLVAGTSTALPGGAAGHSITAVGNGWYRCVVTIASASAAVVWVVLTNGTSDSYLGDGASGVFLWGYQAEEGALVSALQQRGANVFDVTEAGVETVTYADFDLVDDTLATGAIAGGLTGQAFVAGDGGCFASTLSIAAGGTFSIGGTFHDWTGAAPGILRAVTGDTGRMLDAVIRTGTFTGEEIARLERFYRSRGGKGLLVADGIERVVNGGFATDSDWTKGTGWTIAGGMATKAAGTGADLSQAAGLIAGAFYRITVSVVAVRATSLIYVLDGNPQAYFDLTRNNPANLVPGTLTGVFRAPNSGQVVLRLGGSASADIDNVSVQRLIPREEL